MIRLALGSAQAQNLPGMEILRGARLEGRGGLMVRDAAHVSS